MSKDWGHDLFFSFCLWFNSKLFEIFMKRGVYYKSLYLVLDRQVYLDSSSLFKFISLGFLLVCWSELFMLQQISKTHPAKWTYGSLWVHTMNDVLGYGCKRPLQTSYLLIALHKTDLPRVWHVCMQAPFRSSLRLCSDAYVNLLH